VSQGGRLAPGDGAGGDAAPRRGWRRGSSRRLRQSERSGGCGEPKGPGCAVFVRQSGAPGGDHLHRCFSYDMLFLYIPSDHLSEVARAEAVRCACAPVSVLLQSSAFHGHPVQGTSYSGPVTATASSAPLCPLSHGRPPPKNTFPAHPATPPSPSPPPSSQEHTLNCTVQPFCQTAGTRAVAEEFGENGCRLEECLLPIRA